jgi:nucleoporin NUP159
MKFNKCSRAPSLDTINRTFRNIEITIEQQSDDVAQLASRINKLSVEDVFLGPPALTTRDARLPNLNRPRAYNITPNVAATTAAALNAERSAQRLKKALLAVRKEPLLNVKVNTAPSAPVAFSTPKKGEDDAFWKVLNNTTGSLFGEPVVPESIPVGVWNLPPDDNFNPTTPSMPHGRRGAGGQRKHQSVPLKRSPGPASGMGGAPTTATATPAATFDWGPLPSFSTPAPAKVPTSFVPISLSNWKK